MRLTREVRFSSVPEVDGARIDSWSGSDGSERLVGFWSIRTTVEGAVDPRTGYVCDLRRLDTLLRDHAIPRLRGSTGLGDPRNARQRLESGDFAPAGAGLSDLFRAAESGVPEGVTLRSVSLHLSPHLFLEARREELPMIRITRSYEFCAAHRLSCPEFSAEENLRMFGKCSNPHGHGHNYVLEVTIAGVPHPRTGVIADGPCVDELVKTHVLDAFDHRNLNVECPEFQGANPSVENIARVIWRKLASVVPQTSRADAVSRSVGLVNVRVWETPKTFADCSGEE